MKQLTWGDVIFHLGIVFTMTAVLDYCNVDLGRVAFAMIVLYMLEKEFTGEARQ